MALNIPRLDMTKLREAAAAAGNRKSSGNAEGYYPFTKTPHGPLPDKSARTILRFLPDGNPANTKGWWSEQWHHRLEFVGIVGQDLSKKCEVKIPSLFNFNEEVDPIMAYINEEGWWKDEQLKEVARKYWKKSSLLMQFFVVRDGVGEQNKPENPIRRATFSGKVADMVRGILSNSGLEYSPTDPDHGRDFFVFTAKGSFGNDYNGSQYDLSERPLNAEELAAIEKHGLPNLSSFAPKRPEGKAAEAIMEMFVASLNQEPYDPERWGKFYRPFGVQAPKSGQAETTSVQVKTPEPVVQSEPEADEAPFDGGTQVATSAVRSSLDALKARTAPKVEEVAESTPAPEAKKPPSKDMAALMAEIAAKANAKKNG